MKRREFMKKMVGGGALVVVGTGAAKAEAPKETDGECAKRILTTPQKTETSTIQDVGCVAVFRRDEDGTLMVTMAISEFDKRANLNDYSRLVPSTCAWSDIGWRTAYGFLLKKEQCPDRYMRGERFGVLVNLPIIE